MTKKLAIEELTRFKNAKDKNELIFIQPNDPLFLIRYISKNAPYLNYLNDIVHHHFDEVLSFVKYLETHDWCLDVVHYIDDNYPDYRFNNGFDLAYIGYLANLISREFFYDFVVFQNIIQSFTGQQTHFKDHHNELVSVPPLPMPDAISSDGTQSRIVLDYIRFANEI